MMRENPAHTDQAGAERSATATVMSHYSVGQLWVDHLVISTPSGAEK